LQFGNQPDRQEFNLLSLANQGDKNPARWERGVHAASPSKRQADRAFDAPRVFGRRSGLKPAPRHRIARASISGATEKIIWSGNKN
jgi:hypothetical protein